MERDFSPAELPYVETSNFEGANRRRPKIDAYFSADVETDGPIPGPYSLLSFAIVYAGRSDGVIFERPKNYETSFYTEVRPISHKFQEEALAVNKIDRQRLMIEGTDPIEAMTEACKWVRTMAGDAEPVLVAYPLSFDWTWLYWYFVNYSLEGSPFGHSKCFDIKTAVAVKARLAISDASRSKLPSHLASRRIHTHHALDDAKEQAEIFANIYEWGGNIGRN